MAKNMMDYMLLEDFVVRNVQEDLLLRLREKK